MFQIQNIFNQVDNSSKCKSLVANLFLGTPMKTIFKDKLSKKFAL